MWSVVDNFDEECFRERWCWNVAGYGGVEYGG